MESSTRTLLGIILVCGVLMVYAASLRNYFVDYDDYSYVVNNAHAEEGFTPGTLRWAFITTEAGLWAPLTRLSHVLDYQLFGTNATGHHLHNVLLHALNSLLLYVFLLRATGRLHASALTAALFALHPMHVESVAWVASRKDVLSAAFMMVTFLAYDAWARNRRPSGLAVAGIACILALLSKPIMVTLPCVLLLLDIWPYRRVTLSGPWRGQRATLRALLLEKAPMFAAAGLVCGITVYAERMAIVPVQQAGLPVRLVNSITSYGFYLWKCLIPYPLYVPYSMNPLLLTWVSAGICLLFLILITFVFWRVRDRAPWGLAGWVWFIGTLVPVIGLVQFGHHAHADRFTYVPFIGLFIVAAWTWDALFEKYAGWQRPLIVAAVAFLMCHAVLASLQARYWKDTMTLFTHTLAWDENNPVALVNLAEAYLHQNHPEKAVVLFERAAQLDQENPDLRNNLAVAYLMLERYDNAERALETAIAKRPDDPELWTNLATAQYYRKNYDAAWKSLDKALSLSPNFDKARNLKIVLESTRRK